MARASLSLRIAKESAMPSVFCQLNHSGWVNSLFCSDGLTPPPIFPEPPLGRSQNRNRLERRTASQGRLSPIPAPKHLNSLAHRLRGRDEFPELWISLQLLILTGRQAGSVEEILQRVAT